MRDAGAREDGGFHLAWLDAHAADFHLVVVAPEIDEIAGRFFRNEIAGAVEALAERRVRDESLARQSRVVPVAAGETEAANP